MGETGTAVDLSTKSSIELVERFEAMKGQIAAHPPPGFDIDEWEHLAAELVSRVPAAAAREGDRY